MANTPINGLPEQTTADPTQLIVVQVAADTRKMLLSTLMSLTGASLIAHQNQTTGAHAATAISAAPNGAVMNGTNVQSQLAEAATALLPTGGTTNQVVAKRSATNFDAAWTDVSTITGAVPPTRQINTAAPLTGGGALSGDLNLAVTQFAGSTPGTVPASPGDATTYLNGQGV